MYARLSSLFLHLQRLMYVLPPDNTEGEKLIINSDYASIELVSGQRFASTAVENK
jgi:hypothetical protein